MPKDEVFGLLKEILSALERVSELTHPLDASDDAKNDIDKNVAKIADLCGKISEKLVEDSE